MTRVYSIVLFWLTLNQQTVASGIAKKKKILMPFFMDNRLLILCFPDLKLWLFKTNCQSLLFFVVY